MLDTLQQAYVLKPGFERTGLAAKAIEQIMTDTLDRTNPESRFVGGDQWSGLSMELKKEYAPIILQAMAEKANAQAFPNQQPEVLVNMGVNPNIGTVPNDIPTADTVVFVRSNKGGAMEGLMVMVLYQTPEEKIDKLEIGTHQERVNRLNNMADVLIQRSQEGRLPISVTVNAFRVPAKGK